MRTPCGILIAALLAMTSIASAGAPGDDDDTVASPAIIVPSSAPVARPAQLTVDDFAIEYRVRFSAFSGSLVLALQTLSDTGAHRVSAVTKARGLTKLLMRNELLEQADFDYTNGTIVPLSYQLDSGKKSGEDTGNIAFNWEEQTAASVYEGAAATLQLQPDVYDRISADIVAIADLLNGRAPRDLLVAEKNQLRPYTFTLQGEESIETPAGKFDTVRYLRQRDGSSRSTLIWYARNAGYLPVRMEQLKHGKTAVTSVARKLTVIAASN